ncbi:hypothetical protein TI04_11615 [Achromatium sp. WMS2]|nr:hypothetical protein TI04_11615 [Achromatium sp. WMS2]
MKDTNCTKIQCLGLVFFVITTILAIVFALALPLYKLNLNYDEQIADLSNNLGRFRALAASVPRLEHQLNMLYKNKNLDAYYITANGSASGGIALQRLIEEIIHRLKVTTNSIQVLPAQDLDAITQLSVRLNFSCSIDALWQLLYDIESSEHILIINSLSIRAMPKRHIQRQVPGTEPSAEPALLNVGMDVYGYIRREST